MDIHKERKRLGLTQKELAEKIGVSYQTIQNWENGKVIPKSKYQIIGMVLNNPETIIKEDLIPKNQNTNIGTPIYDIDFMAGSVSVFQDGMVELIGHLDIPELKGSEKVIRAKGDSMLGVIDDRDFIGIRKINDFSFFNYGSPYAIVTSDYRLLKFIRKSENPDNIILRSSNPEYDDIELPKSKILELYIITAVLPF